MVFNSPRNKIRTDCPTSKKGREVLRALDGAQVIWDARIMEQAGKQSLWSILGSGILSALCSAIGRYETIAAPSSAAGMAVAEFFAVIGWLLLAAAVLLMVVRAVKSVRS
jgi:hypothetical protein